MKAKECPFSQNCNIKTFDESAEGLCQLQVLAFKAWLLDNSEAEKELLELSKSVYCPKCQRVIPIYEECDILT